jgi:hypothetical protein
MKHLILTLSAWTMASAVATGAQVSVSSSTLLERRALPGESYTGTVVLTNASDVPQRARLTRSDYDFQADGRTRFPAVGTLPRSNAAWIRGLAPSITIPPGESVRASFSVQVPGAADSLIGSYWSAILVETEPLAAPPAASAKRPEFSLRMNVRYAVQVATHVGTAGSAQLTFAGVRSALDSAGRPVLELDVANAGQRALRPAITVELYAENGELVSRQRDQRGLIYPGTSARQRFAFDALKAGQYTALVLADAGGSEVFGIQIRVKY